MGACWIRKGAVSGERREQSFRKPSSRCIIRDDCSKPTKQVSHMLRTPIVLVRRRMSSYRLSQADLAKKAARREKRLANPEANAASSIIQRHWIPVPSPPLAVESRSSIKVFTWNASVDSFPSIYLVLTFPQLLAQCLVRMLAAPLSTVNCFNQSSFRKRPFPY
jgi:hypothetical protein